MNDPRNPDQRPERGLQRRPRLSRLLQCRVGQSASAPALADAMLEDALREGASDIHLDPLRSGYSVRMRIDGALVDTVTLPPTEGLHILRAFKARADMDPAVAIRPQDGRAELRAGGRPVAVRVATAPTVLGEKLALRLLTAEVARLAVDELGLSPQDSQELWRAVQDARGMILVSGPTGSGKTTTLYAIMGELMEAGRSVASIEDPVEYVVEGVTQVQVNARQGLTIPEGVRGLLRLDPDVIVIGEIRDALSARSALDAADSGHVFLSSLHARDVAGTITALRNFGLDSHEIAAVVDVVVAQRLVRRLCPACRKQEPPTTSEVEWLEFYSQPVPTRTWHAGGCRECGDSGYRGRIGIFEVLRMREELADLILRRADERTLRRHIRRSGTLSLLEDDLAKVAQGITSLEELATVGGMGFCCSAVINRPTAPPPGAGADQKP